MWVRRTIQLFKRLLCICWGKTSSMQALYVVTNKCNQVETPEKIWHPRSSDYLATNAVICSLNQGVTHRRIGCGSLAFLGSTNGKQPRHWGAIAAAAANTKGKTHGIMELSTGSGIPMPKYGFCCVSAYWLGFLLHVPAQHRC